LRLHPPLHFGWRRVKAPIELNGEEIPEGTMLTIMLAAANRDPSVFANPDIFDAERSNARDHIAFEVGIHTCLGAALARLEARIAFDRLIPLLEKCEPSGEAIENEAVLFQGLASLPVRRARVIA
jgi:cytochrome P450